MCTIVKSDLLERIVVLKDFVGDADEDFASVETSGQYLVTHIFCTKISTIQLNLNTANNNRIFKIFSRCLHLV